MCYEIRKKEKKTKQNARKNVSNKHTFAAQYIKYCISFVTRNSYMCVRNLRFDFFFHLKVNATANAKGNKRK